MFTDCETKNRILADTQFLVAVCHIQSINFLVLFEILPVKFRTLFQLRLTSSGSELLLVPKSSSSVESVVNSIVCEL